MDVGKVVTAEYHSDGAIGSVWVARLRPFAVVTLVFLAWWAIGPWNYVQAMELDRAKAGLTPVAATVSSDSNKIDNAVRQVRRALDRLRTEAGDAGDSLSASALGEAVDELEARFAALEALDAEILDGFDAVEEHLDRAALPAQIRQRLHHAETAYVQGFRDLRRDIQRTIQEARQLARNGRNARAEEVSAQRQSLVESIDVSTAGLEAMIGPERHTPLDPQNLPHRPPEPETRQPRTTVDAFTELSEAARVTTIVSQDDPDGEEKRVLTAPVIGLGAAATLPEPADLEETVEVQLTPEITGLAAALGNDPRRIFDFVHDEIRFTPTHGSIQGAASCLRTRLCNDLDTASLLIALLRASGIPARYALGTVEAPVGEVMNLLGGFTDPAAALNFMASSGTPVTGVTSGGELVTARFEHVWVEAFLDYIPSRGAVAGGEGDTWVPLDASFKKLALTEGVDVAAATGFDAAALLNQVFEDLTFDETTGAIQDVDIALIEQSAAAVQTQLLAFLDAEGVPPTLRDMAGGSTVVAQALPVLPGSLPHRVLVRAGQFAEVPSALRHGLRFEVASDRFGLFADLTYSASLPELAGRKITLSYDPATDADRQTLQSFAPQGPDVTAADFPTSLPAFLVQVRPELRIDGELVASGAAVTLGQSGRFRMFFSSPGVPNQTVDNVISAGTYNAIVLNLGVAEDPATRRQEAQSVLDRIEAEDLGDLTEDEVFGEFLHSAGLLYWSQLEFFDRTVAPSRGIVTAQLPSEGIFTYDLQVFSLFGAPREVRSGALVTDVDSHIQAVAALDGSAGTAADYFALAGGFSSRQESEIWDEAVNETRSGAGITTMSYLEAAVRQNIPLYHITQDNLSVALPELEVSSAVLNDIRNAVNAGREVTIPQRELLKDGFFGVGYIVLDPDTGAGGYLISSGLAGGGFQLPTIPGSPGSVALLSLLLIAIGAFATLAAAAGVAGAALVSLIAAIAAVLLTVYDAVSTYQEITRNNPNMSDTGRDGVAALLTFAAVIGVGLSLLALAVTTPLSVIALIAVVAMFWVIYAMVIAFAAAVLANVDQTINERPDPPFLIARVLRWLLERFSGDPPPHPSGADLVDLSIFRPEVAS